MKKLAILLTVHNRKEKTLECLERLFAYKALDGWSISVFMTDDGSTDGTGDAVRERYSEVIIVEGDGNLYWNRGMLAAWKCSVSTDDFDGYLWLNDDTVLEVDALQDLVNGADKYPDAILVGATKSRTGEEITYGGLDDRENRIRPDGTYRKCRTMNGNIVLVTRNAFKKLGFLDPVYSHSTGDVDYGLTAGERGVPVLLLPRACGRCDRNPGVLKWMNPDVPFVERVRSLWHPLSYSRPPEFFHFKRKHWGVAAACLSMLSISLNVISPKLWRRLRRK